MTWLRITEQATAATIDSESVRLVVRSNETTLRIADGISRAYLLASLAGYATIDHDHAGDYDPAGSAAAAQAYAAGLVDDLSGVTDAVTARGNLGLGTAAVEDVGAFEPTLGNPGTDGYVLVSTAAGVRSWEEMSGGGVEFPWQPASDGVYSILQNAAGTNDALAVHTSALALILDSTGGIRPDVDSSAWPLVQDASGTAILLVNTTSGWLVIDDVIIGNRADVNGAVVFGTDVLNNSTGSTTGNHLAIGPSAGRFVNFSSASSSSFVLIGRNALYNAQPNGETTVYGTNAGQNLTGRGTYIGPNSGFGASGNGVAVGDSAANSASGQAFSLLGDAAGQNATGTNIVGVGNRAAYGCSSGNVAAVGNSAFENSSGNSVIGLGTNVGKNNTRARVALFGYGAVATADEQIVFGSDNTNNGDFTTMYLGRGVVSALGKQEFSINATGGSGTNIAGWDLEIAAGRPTGSGAGGKITFATANAGSSGTTLQSLSDRMTINADGSIIIHSLPTSDPAVAGQLWSDGGTLKISAG